MRRMYSIKQLTEFTKKYLENATNLEAILNTISVKGLNILSTDGETYAPIDYNYIDEDDHRVVILDNLHVSGAITADTIEQAQANWEYNEEIAIPSTQYGCSVSPIFANVSQFNRKLNIILIVKVENTTGDSVVIPDIDCGTIIFPNEIAEKIIDYEGETAKTAVVQNTLISGNFSYASVSGSAIPNFFFLLTNTTTANTISLKFTRSGSYTLPNNTSLYLEARIELVI